MSRTPAAKAPGAARGSAGRGGERTTIGKRGDPGFEHGEIIAEEWRQTVEFEPRQAGAGKGELPTRGAEGRLETRRSEHDLTNPAEVAAPVGTEAGLE